MRTSIHSCWEMALEERCSDGHVGGTTGLYTVLVGYIITFKKIKPLSFANFLSRKGAETQSPLDWSSNTEAEDLSV